MIAYTHRMAILLSVWAAAGRQGASFVCRRVAVKYAKMTRVTPLISVLFHIVICQYHFLCSWYPKYGGIFSHMLSKIPSRSYFFKNPSIQSMRCFKIPRKILCKISLWTMRGEVMPLRIHKVLVNGLTPAAFRFVKVSCHSLKVL